MRQVPTFWRLLLRKALSVQAVVLGVAALGVGLFLQANIWNPINWLVFGLIAELFCIVVLASMLYEVWPFLRRTLPKVRSAGRIMIRGEAFVQLLLEPSELFGFDSMVTAYRKNGDFEELVGIGHVSTIHETGRIQVLMDNVADSADGQFIQRLLDGNAEAISNTIVKPTVPRPQHYGST